MSSGFCRLGLPIGLAVALAACSAGGGYIERVEAKRADQDESTREGETTPFTPVDLRMVAPGEQEVVALCDDEVRFDPEEECAESVTLRFTGDRFVEIGADGTETDPGRIVPLGRFRLTLAPQGEKARIQVHDPDSPDQKSFHGYRWYAIDPAYRFAVTVEPYPEEEPVRMTTTAGLVKTFRRYGKVKFDIGGTEYDLSVFLAEDGDPSDPRQFFIPFRDATAGKETYAVGRYVGLSEEDGAWYLDFNMAGNPNCAYNPYWNCPIPPKENWLSVAIPAGELPYGDTAHG